MPSGTFSAQVETGAQKQTRMDTTGLFRVLVSEVYRDAARERIHLINLDSF